MKCLWLEGKILSSTFRLCVNKVFILYNVECNIIESNKQCNEMSEDIIKERKHYNKELYIL
jgi:hypothetical protein